MSNWCAIWEIMFICFLCGDQDESNMMMEASLPSWHASSSPCPSSGEDDERTLGTAPVREAAFRKGACHALAGGHAGRVTSAKRKASPSECHGSAYKAARHSEAQLDKVGWHIKLVDEVAGKSVEI